MAGLNTTYISSKELHEDVGDYNDLVIVPKSILIDTADAIRLKKDGSSAVEGWNSTGAITSNNAIQPVNFATEIGNISAGNSSMIDLATLFQTATKESTWSDTTTPPRFHWKGDFRKCLYAWVTWHTNSYYANIGIVTPKQVYTAIANNNTNVSCYFWQMGGNGLSTPSTNRGSLSVAKSLFTASFGAVSSTDFYASTNVSGASVRAVQNGYQAFADTCFTELQAT